MIRRSGSSNEYRSRRINRLRRGSVLHNGGGSCILYDRCGLNCVSNHRRLLHDIGRRGITTSEISHKKENRDEQSNRCDGPVYSTIRVVSHLSKLRNGDSSGKKACTRSQPRSKQGKDHLAL